jgi:hypothetical protein
MLAEESSISSPNSLHLPGPACRISIIVRFSTKTGQDLDTINPPARPHVEPGQCLSPPRIWAQISDGLVLVLVLVLMPWQKFTYRTKIHLRLSFHLAGQKVGCVRLRTRTRVRLLQTHGRLGQKSVVSFADW